MKTVICYFSASNNGYEIVIKLKEEFDCDIKNIIRLNIEELKQYERIIIVTPIYSFGIALPIEEFIIKLKELSDKEYVLILNKAGFSANTKYQANILFDSLDLNLINIYEVMMPVSFSTVIVLSDKINNSIKKKLKQNVSKIAYSIKEGKNQGYKSNIFAFLDKQRLKNITAIKLMAQDFSVNDECVLCNLCVTICPMSNIDNKDDKIIFNKNCCSCLGCYNRCPKEAILYKGKCGKKYQNIIN